jgi:hypothetical protein
VFCRYTSPRRQPANAFVVLTTISLSVDRNAIATREQREDYKVQWQVYRGTSRRQQDFYSGVIDWFIDTVLMDVMIVSKDHLLGARQ